MSEAPFANVASPLTAVPLLVGLFIGLWSCLAVVSGHYGLDLAAAFPGVHVEPGYWGPLILLGVAVFAFFRGQKMRDVDAQGGTREARTFRPFSLVEKLCFGGAAIGIVTLPYWLAAPAVEVWAAGLLLLLAVVFKKCQSGASS